MLIDSLGHATLSGNWITKNLRCSFADYSRELAENGFRAGMAVGLASVGGYEHGPFMAEVTKHPNLFGIAGFNPRVESASTLAGLQAMGFVAIKIHFRFSRLSLAADAQSITATLAECERIRLPVFLCTYCYCKNTPDADHNFADQLFPFLSHFPRLKVVLVHGGAVRLMEYAEWVRHNDNYLLDLSLTFMKYRGSSIDQDIRFLFQSFDQRICIGSDYPEYSLADVRNRFDEFSQNLSAEKIERIAGGNLVRFLGLRMQP